MANKINSDKKLLELTELRQENIQKILQEWDEQDFVDMKAAYSVAKDIAIEKNNELSIKINEEKLAQLEEAWSLKQQNLLPDAST